MGYTGSSLGLEVTLYFLSRKGTLSPHLETPAVCDVLGKAETSLIKGKSALPWSPRSERAFLDNTDRWNV